MVRRRRLVLAAWAVLLVACAAAYPFLRAHLRAPDYGVGGAESTRAERLVDRHFGALGAEQDLIVFRSGRHVVTDPAYRAVVDRTVRAARGVSGVGTVTGPFGDRASHRISPDRHVAIAVAGLRGDAAARAAHADDLRSAVRGADGTRVRAYVTGYSPIANDLGTVEEADAGRAESIGIPVAFVVLVFALGALVAALVPLATAGAGLLLAFGVLAAICVPLHVDAFMTTIVAMIGTGIGIDYSLFIVSRFREELARGAGTADAAGTAIATSGRTVMFSGVIVMIALCSLFVVDAPIFREIALGVLVVVLCTLAVALTLLPALLGVLGPRVNAGALPARLRPAETRPGRAAGGWARWARTVMRRPVTCGVLAGALLVLAALPVGAMRYGIDLGTSSLSATPAGKGQRALTRSFGPGLLAPTRAVVTGPDDRPLGADGRARAARLERSLRADSRVAAVAARTAGGRVLIEVVPSVAIDSTAATGLVRGIREDAAAHGGGPDGSRVLVGGTTAQFVDLNAETSAMFPVVLALVLGASLVLLLPVFRSVVLPVKAVAMNLLATAAALGCTVAVFQLGHGAGLLGFTSTGFLQVYVPMTVFALLFGMSMDYEVFLIGRMAEERHAGRDNTAAVAGGIAHTARPISAAALIMVVVFGSFVTADVLELKEFGFALAVAVALDATLVRLVLVPAFMRLLGARNWWLPRRLDRRLPRAGA